NYDFHNVSSNLMNINKVFYIGGDTILKQISSQNYNILNQLVSKTLGNNLESLSFDYNIRGWLTGINKEYVGDRRIQSKFGMVISYDYGFEHNQLNGNISGIKWRSFGDEIQRAYGFGYDKVNRLLYADFNHLSVQDNWDKSDGIDFTSIMGDGQNPSTAYDANGNILRMKQWGLKGMSSNVIDDLH